MKILGIERDTTACNHYRVIQPLVKLQQKGLAETLTISDSMLATEEAFNKVLNADIVIFQRPANKEWFKFIQKCQEMGKIIVTDYDDDPFNTSPLNPYYKFVGVKEWNYKWPDGSVSELWKDGVNGFDIERNISRQDMFRASFRRADIVTTTTGLLRDSFLKINKNVAVLPNLIDFNLYAKPDINKKEIRIGYQCGASHYEDIYMVREALTEVMKRNENVKFVYFGDYRFIRLFQDIPTNRKEIHDWVPYAAYPFKLALLNLDVGICPLVDNTFNKNKSAIKWMEYSAMGAATVASNLPPYDPVIQHGQTGYLATTKEEWVEYLEILIKDESKRKEISNKAYEDVYENHNSNNKAHLWAEAYESILKQDVASYVGV